MAKNLKKVLIKGNVWLNSLSVFLKLFKNVLTCKPFPNISENPIAKTHRVRLAKATFEKKNSLF